MVSHTITNTFPGGKNHGCHTVEEEHYLSSDQQDVVVLCHTAKDSGKFLNTPHSVGWDQDAVLQECMADLSFSCLVTR